MSPKPSTLNPQFSDSLSANPSPTGVGEGGHRLGEGCADKKPTSAERAGVRCRNQGSNPAVRAPHSTLPPLLLEHFDSLAESPEAIAKLRGFVRDLAVRGRLVPQNSKDEPSTELLKRILDEKRHLNREDGENASTIFKPFAADDCPFAIPAGWTWVKTQDVTTYVQRGKSPKYTTEQKIPVIAQKCIQWHGFELHKAQFIAPESLESYSEDRFVRDGDLLWNSTGLGTLGRIIVFRERFKGAYSQIVADSHVTVIRPSKLVDPDYLFCWFAGPTVQSEINAKASGSTKQTELATSTVLSYAIPLPPLAEQRRIVAKVEELLALCDELEARQTTAREARTHFVRSALSHLSNAQDEADFKKHSVFCLQHSELLFDAVPQLRQAILSLAVQGKLAPQNPNDESAAALLGKIRAAKHRMAESSGAKPPKVWPATDRDELPFPLPQNWAATCLGDLATEIEAGFSPQCEGRVKNESEWGVLKISAVSWDEFDPDENKALPAHVAPRPEYEIHDGDFIMSRANTAELVAKSVVTHKPPPRLLLNDKTLRVHFTEHTDKRFLNMVNNSSVSRAYYAKAASGTSSSMKNITREGVSMLPIALPPLAEQKRIVAKVEDLMRWCDALEAQLTTARTAATHLLDATLHQILNN